MAMIKLCECGCGQPTNYHRGKYNRFINGHSRIGKHSSKETKQKIKDNHIDISGKNNPNFKHGKTLIKNYCKECGKIICYKSIYCDRCKCSGERGSNYIDGRKNRKHYCKTCGNEVVNYKSTYCKNCYHLKGNEHWNWQGGISFEPYPPTFNQQLKDRIRVRDNFICQLCGVPELECDRRLTIHHIDYDKQNCKEDNLTSLCCSCNGKVNFNREHWTNYFQERMKNDNLGFDFTRISPSGCILVCRN